MANIETIARKYQKRFADFSLPIHFEYSKQLRTIIVIPCYKEPNVLATLQSLKSNATPLNPCLVLVLVNASENAPQSTKDFNQNTFFDIENFIAENKNLPNLQFEVFLNNNMPAKDAGVGYARKSLMDTALQIFAQINYNGTIVNTDADCLFTSHYIQSIEKVFSQKNIDLAVMHYEHRIEDAPNATLAKAITEYELHLRYYKQALVWAGYPNVLETIGSCMVCTAMIYALEGGMNKRKAGEDFYFINKLAKKHRATTITSAKVLPSCRTSDRVPFGTGKAMNDYVSQNTEILLSYDFNCFHLLKKTLQAIDVLFTNGLDAFWAKISPLAQDYFQQISLEKHLPKIIKQSTSVESFKKRFFLWFDHLKVLQFIHFCTEKSFSKQAINQEAIKYLETRSVKKYSAKKAFDLLLIYRANEQNA